MERREFLRGGLALGCCAAAAPMLSPVTVAAAPGENRLVVIILRGGMDGLGVVSPYGDRDWAGLRPKIAAAPGEGLIDLDGRFGLHKGLGALKPLWDRGQLAFAHAVSTPYRDKRSHFDGQDILEAGTVGVADVRDGWINRALAHLPGAGVDTAYAVGRESMLITSGDRPFRSWAPGQTVPLEEDERQLLQLIYRNDPLFANAARSAMDLAATTGDRVAEGGKAAEVLAEYTAARMREEARIASFSLGGWDTHVNQPFALRGAVKQLETAVATLHRDLGPVWDSTLVVAMTEFGRTARENGGKGTDHGTGGCALLAGGALSRAAVHGDWPGLGESDLYQGRDLMPTRDVRHYPAWALRRMFGVPPAALSRDVFPGLDMGAEGGFLA